MMLFLILISHLFVTFQIIFLKATIALLFYVIVVFTLLRTHW